MVKDGEDWHGLLTTKLKSLAKLFKPIQLWHSSFKKHRMLSRMRKLDRSFEPFVYKSLQYGMNFFGAFPIYTRSTRRRAKWAPFANQFGETTWIWDTGNKSNAISNFEFKISQVTVIKCFILNWSHSASSKSETSKLCLSSIQEFATRYQRKTLAQHIFRSMKSKHWVICAALCWLATPAKQFRSRNTGKILQKNAYNSSHGSSYFRDGHILWTQ